MAHDIISEPPLLSYDVFKIGRKKFADSVTFNEGLSDLASISPVSDYWTNWPSVEVMAFVKDVRNVEILNLEPKKVGAFFC